MAGIRVGKPQTTQTASKQNYMHGEQRCCPLECRRCHLENDEEPGHARVRLHYGSLQLRINSLQAVDLLRGEAVAVDQDDSLVITLEQSAPSAIQV